MRSTAIRNAWHAVRAWWPYPRRAGPRFQTILAAALDRETGPALELDLIERVLARGSSRDSTNLQKRR